MLAVAMALAWAPAALGQVARERFWLAYRYDATHVIVYFDTVKFNGTLPASAEKLARPQADGFLNPVALPASYVAKFQKQPGSERFAVGGRYDLLLDSGRVATLTLTTVVGDEGDEGTGGQSFIGAIGSVARTGRAFFTKDFYAVRRHVTAQKPTPASRSRQAAPKAGLGDTVVQADVKERIGKLLTERLKADSDAAARSAAETVDPSISVREFKTAEGRVRYFAAAMWPFTQSSGRAAYKLGGWFAAKPSIQLLAAETCLCEIDTPQLPRLLNVVDLGRGRTGIIVEIKGEFAWEFALYEYRDGLDLRKMRLLQSMGVGD